jgi:hypothetical protein
MSSSFSRQKEGREGAAAPTTRRRAAAAADVGTASDDDEEFYLCPEDDEGAEERTQRLKAEYAAELKAGKATTKETKEKEQPQGVEKVCSPVPWTA